VHWCPGTFATGWADYYAFGVFRAIDHMSTELHELILFEPLALHVEIGDRIVNLRRVRECEDAGNLFGAESGRVAVEGLAHGLETVDELRRSRW